MVNVGKKSKIQIHWKVNPYDYSSEKMNSLITLTSSKYNIPKENVKIIPDFIVLNSKGEKMNLSNDVLLNIQNPEFQIKLFDEYLNVNEIKDYDFDFIKKIDSEINGNIDYNSFDKYRQYKIKWIKWSNFLSYGKDNFFDFTTLNGLVLLNGEPANQSGKTTFAIDLLHFLLFGKTTKETLQDKIFNRWLKDETEMIVEGCLEIEGEEYIIKRRLTRPQRKKRTSSSKTTQKVEYYRIVGGNEEELVDYIDNQQEENSRKTNKIIKESIGNENDFDLMICATSKNISDLIEKKATERGRILSRWTGLLPLEEKETIAKEKFNNTIKPYLYSNNYNIETLNKECGLLHLQIDEYKNQINLFEKKTTEVNKSIEEIEKTKEVLISAKQQINKDVERIDITTLMNSINTITTQGQTKKSEIVLLKDQINEYEGITFSEIDYDYLLQLKTEKTKLITEKRSEAKYIKTTIDDLKTSEYCPTCGRKYENIDNSSKIAELTEKYNKLVEDGISISNEIKIIDEKINSLKDLREKFKIKTNCEMKISALEVQIEKLRSELIEKRNILKEYESNKIAINKNNEIELNLRNYEVQLKGYYKTKEENIIYISSLKSKIEMLEKEIDNREKMVLKLQEEEIIVRNWKIYLDMIGKNGISKMVLRKALPIINAQLAHLLNDVSDFNVEIEMTEKNEVCFSIIKDNEKIDISGGSGFEQTAAALALRFVLAKNSVMPKLSYIVLDELFGLVADENLDKMHILLDKIKSDYSAMIIVSHKNIVKEWCNTIITVTKENNVSRLVTKSSGK